jgi:hypothetical protein
MVVGQAHILGKKSSAHLHLPHSIITLFFCICRGDLSFMIQIWMTCVAGLNNLWQSRRWKQMIPEFDMGNSSMMSCPTVVDLNVGVRDAGVRRGLMHAMMRMMVTKEVWSGVIVIMHM